MTASAQSGAILFDRSVQYDFELPERLAGLRDRLPAANISQMLLLFNGSASLLVSSPPEEEEGEPRPGLAPRERGMLLQRLRMGSTSRSDQETLVGGQNPIRPEIVSVSLGEME